MDHPLESLVTSSARNLLSTSQCFEPYIPLSPNNTHYSLSLLGKLGEITRVSLGDLRAAIANPPAPAASKEKKSTTRPLSESHPSIKDASLLEALEKLRHSSHFFKKNPRVLSAIIHPERS